MLTRLRFKNFKAWPDSGDIRLAPLTVLFGTNSAGKASIAQLLLMMKQTAASPDRQRALQLGDNRSLVELGVYDDIVYQHDVAKPLEIELEWTTPESLQVPDPVSGHQYSGDRFGFRVQLLGDRRHQPVVQSFRYDLSGEAGPALDIEMRRVDSGKTFELKSSQYRLVRHAGRARPLPEPLRSYGFPDEVKATIKMPRSRQTSFSRSRSSSEASTTSVHFVTIRVASTFGLERFQSMLESRVRKPSRLFWCHNSSQAGSGRWGS